GPVVGAHAALGQQPAHPTAVARRAADWAGVTLSRALPPREKRIRQERLAHHGEQPRGEVLPVERRRPARAPGRDEWMAAVGGGYETCARRGVAGRCRGC